MSGIVELKDFEQDLKIINERLDNLNKQFEENIKYRNNKTFNPKKVMINRDIEYIFSNTSKDKEFILEEWNFKSKKEKQDFISRYVESVTFEKNSEYKNGIRLIDLKLKSIYKEKIDKLTSIGASEFYLPLIVNEEKEELIKTNCPITREQLTKYLKELENYPGLYFKEIEDFCETIDTCNKGVSVMLEDNESIDKIIPILEDEYVRSNNPKFKIGILYSKKVVMENKIGSN